MNTDTRLPVHLKRPEWHMADNPQHVARNLCHSQSENLWLLQLSWQEIHVAKLLHYHHPEAVVGYLKIDDLYDELAHAPALAGLGMQDNILGLQMLWEIVKTRCEANIESLYASAFIG